MKRYISAITLAVVLLAIGAALGKYSERSRLTPQQTIQITSTSPTGDVDADFSQEPLWAYGFVTPPARGDTAIPQPPPTRALRPGEDSAEQTRPRRLDGSRASYSLVDIRDGHNAIDWFPEDHPAMPSVVAHGPAALGERGRGCGFCHLPNGKGRPENAPLAGLSVPYFIRQIEDFRSGRRRSADPRKANTNTMIELAKALTEEEARDAAEYFASIRYTPWIRVVETDSVPATRIVGNLFLPISRSKIEPIAGRIIEVPEHVEQTELYRNPRSGFVAYVPTGSIRKGEDLVTNGGSAGVGGAGIQPKTIPCGTCHGPDLTGMAEVPPIAGRSPSYIVRQLWDIQQGTRNGESAQVMKPVVANLTRDDLVAIAAYVSSRKPGRSGSADHGNGRTPPRGGALLGASPSLAQTAGPTAASDHDSVEVHAALDSFLRAFENLLWEGFRASFSDSATVFFPSAATPRRFVGRAAVEARFQQEFADIRAQASTGPPYMLLEPRGLQVAVLDERTALVTFELRSEVRLARRSFVFVRESAGWRIRHLHASNVPWPDQPAR